MLRFWYRFIPDAMEAIEIGKGDLYYYQNVKPYLYSFMGSVFEKMCRQYTLKTGITGNFQCTITKVGTWWGTNPEKKTETDIDVVGLDPGNKQAVIGECKFRHEITDKKAYDSLIERQTLLHQNYRVVQFLLFSASGFSDWIVTESKKGLLRCIDLEAMFHLNSSEEQKIYL